MHPPFHFYHPNLWFYYALFSKRSNKLYGRQHRASEFLCGQIVGDVMMCLAANSKSDSSQFRTEDRAEHENKHTKHMLAEPRKRFYKCEKVRLCTVAWMTLDFVHLLPHVTTSYRNWQHICNLMSRISLCKQTCTASKMFNIL